MTQDRREPSTILASSTEVMLERLSLAHCYSLTVPGGIAAGCISLFFFGQKSLSVISAQSAYCKLQAREQLNSQCCRDPL